MAFQGNGGGALNEINITPLVDVMLVLLVVFMVTTPIIAEEMIMRKVEIDMPNTNAKPVEASDLKTMILVNEQYQVLLDIGDGPAPLVECAGQPDLDLCLDPLAVKLKGNPRLEASQPIFLFAARRLPYGFIVDVMARIKEAGFAKVGLVTNPPKAAQ
jgi:biopolymer transport protein ExbD